MQLTPLGRIFGWIVLIGLFIGAIGGVEPFRNATRFRDYCLGVFFLIAVVVMFVFMAEGFGLLYACG